MKALYQALVEAQADIKNATLNKVNPHFKNKYADLVSIREALIPEFAKHGLTVVQLMEIRDGSTVLVTRLVHKSGEHLDSVYPLNAEKQTPQSMGSAITYARRYCLAAIGGVASEDDDDGHQATDQSKKAKAQPSAPEPTQAQKDGAEDVKKSVMACKTVAALDDLAASDLFKGMVSELPNSLAQYIRREWSDRKAYLKSIEKTQTSNDELTGGDLGNGQAREMSPLEAG